MNMVCRLLFIDSTDLCYVYVVVVVVVVVDVVVDVVAVVAISCFNLSTNLLYFFSVFPPLLLGYRTKKV